MKKNRRAWIAACLIAACMTISVAAQANFADDWVSQTSGTNPGYFKGSQRGYFTGGSFSARWPQSSDNLVSISKPSIKSGCGGIDAFAGGLSFLDADYLVDKMQRILAAAPAAAFDIALKTLAPQVADTIKGLESIINKLNGLQLDDCKASKAMVATLADYSPLKNDALQAEIDSSQTDFMVSSGASALYDKFQKLKKGEFKENPGQSASAKAATKGAMNGCPAVLKSLFSGGSVLSNLGADRGLSADYINTIRGFIGDVWIDSEDSTGTTIKGSYIANCGKSTFAGVIDGTAQIRKTGTDKVCEDSTDTNRNLTLYVTNSFISITASLKARSALKPEDIALMQSIPLPVLPALRAAAMSGNESAIIGKLADVSAKGMAYGMMLDLIVRIQQMQQYSKQVISAQNSADGQAPETCQMAMFSQPIERLEELEKNTLDKLSEARQGYNLAVAEAQSVDTLVANLEKFSNNARKILTQQFGRGAADRLLN